MKTAVVTGATGCIGGAVVEALLADERESWRIHIITRPTSDLRRASRFLSRVEYGWPDAGTRIDAIFHCAGNTSYRDRDIDDIYRDNVTFTEKMVTEAMVRKAGCFIFTSTAAAHMYPYPHNTGFVQNHYAMSKSIAEKIVAHFDGYVILQPCVVIGPHDYRNYSALFNLARDNKIIGAMPGGIEFGYVGDIAKAHVEAYWYGKRCGKYILGGVKASWLEFFETIHAVVGNPKVLRVIPSWKLRAYCLWLKAKNVLGGDDPIITSALVDLLAVDASVPLADARKSRDDLGYRPSRTLAQMLEEAYRWRKGIVAA